MTDGEDPVVSRRLNRRGHSLSIFYLNLKETQ